MKCVASIVAVLACFAVLPLSAQAAPHFQHVIVIVQENRTPDHLFQGLCAPPYGSGQSCSTSPGPGQYNIQTSNWLDETTARGVIQPDRSGWETLTTWITPTAHTSKCATTCLH